MPRNVFVSLLPSLIDVVRLRGSSAVVIDVLRASTTVCAALEAGASRIIPVATVEEARRLADQLGQTGERPLLGGERGGVKIDGFDLGNSPLEYRPETVAGRTVIFTTTNGTRALLATEGAAERYLGAFANLNSLADRLAANAGDLHLVCAGTDGQVTLEDTFCAGMILTALMERSTDVVIANDEAAIAQTLPNLWSSEEERLYALQTSLGGRNLAELGYEADIEFSARIGTASVVPYFRNGALISAHQASATSEQAASPEGGEWAI